MTYVKAVQAKTKETFMQTRMTTFIKAKLKKSYDQTNTVKYRVATDITEYHIISKLIFLTIIKNVFKNKRNQHDLNGCMKLIEQFLHA